MNRPTATSPRQPVREAAALAKSERQTASTRRAHKARDPTACVIGDARPWARLSHKLRSPAFTARDERTGRLGIAMRPLASDPPFVRCASETRRFETLVNTRLRHSRRRGGTLAASLTKAGAGICVDATRVRLRIARLARAGRVRVRVLGLVWCLSRTSGAARGTSGG